MISVKVISPFFSIDSIGIALLSVAVAGCKRISLSDFLLFSDSPCSHGLWYIRLCPPVCTDFLNLNRRLLLVGSKSLILHRNRSWHQSNPDPRCNSCFFVLGVRKSSRCGMVYADTGTDTYTATFIFCPRSNTVNFGFQILFTPNAPFLFCFP